MKQWRMAVCLLLNIGAKLQKNGEKKERKMAKKHKKEASFGAFFWCADFWGGARLKMMVSGPFHECSGWRRTPFVLVCRPTKKGLQSHCSPSYSCRQGFTPSC